MVEMADSNAQENLTKDASTAADVFLLPHDQLGKLVDVKLTPSHMVSKHKLLTTTSLSLMKKMLNHMKQSLLKLNWVAT